MKQKFGGQLLTFGRPAAFGRLCVETSKSPVNIRVRDQPPSGGCVLKLDLLPFHADKRAQPPSGGCVLKLAGNNSLKLLFWPAAFGRLCVETDIDGYFWPSKLPAAFGRLCVETMRDAISRSISNPAAFGRLCVETMRHGIGLIPKPQPPSGGCVLKLAHDCVLT